MSQREAGARPAPQRRPASPLAALTRAELRMGLRRPTVRVLALAAAVLGWAIGAEPGQGASLSAYAAAEAGWQYVGLLGIAWLALVAVREASLRTDVLVYSKPQAGENLVLARYLGALIQVLLVLAALFVGAALSRWRASGTLLGASAYGVQWARAAGAVFFATAAAYCLAQLSGSVVAGALVGMAWIVALAGREFLAKVYFPAYSQNLPAYVAFGAALVCLTALVYRRRWRGDIPAARWLKVAVPALLLFGAWAVAATVRTGSDPLARIDPTLDRMSEQNIVVGERTPGFLLPDQHGRPTSLSRFPDRILIVALWSPRETESVLLLAHLADLYRRYGSRGVLPVAICISEDQGAAAAFARGEALDYPVVYDWGAHNAPKWSEASPIASAYQAAALPTVVVTDRRRRARAILTGAATYGGAELENVILRRLADEPR